jgi:hypothetical protein
VPRPVVRVKPTQSVEASTYLRVARRVRRVDKPQSVEASTYMRAARRVMRVKKLQSLEASTHMRVARNPPCCTSPPTGFAGHLPGERGVQNSAAAHRLLSQWVRVWA